MKNPKTWIISEGGRVFLENIEKIICYPNAKNQEPHASKCFFVLKESGALICINSDDVQYFNEEYGITVNIIQSGDIQ